MPILCNNFYAIWNNFWWRIFGNISSRSVWPRTKEWQKCEYEYDFFQLFGNTVRRTFTESEKCVQLCRTVACTMHTQTECDWIQLQISWTCPEFQQRDRQHVGSFVRLHDSVWVSLHTQFIFMLNSVFMVLHSIKFDFYSCTIKTWPNEECGWWSETGCRERE